MQNISAKNNKSNHNIGEKNSENKSGKKLLSDNNNAKNWHKMQQNFFLLWIPQGR